jgi:hypothetical protein
MGTTWRPSASPLRFAYLPILPLLTTDYCLLPTWVVHGVDSFFLKRAYCLQRKVGAGIFKLS